MQHEHSKVTYYPLFVIVSYIVLATVLSSVWNGIGAMSLFMWYFFLFFSLFKMLDVPAFAMAYKKYDVLAASIPWWGKLYPFVELILAGFYLSWYANKAVHSVTAVLMLVGLIGVTRSVLNKQKIKCACLGTGFNLPMSTITIIEDAVMILMAVGMFYGST